MIDFHNHVLPDVDDGPSTLEISMDMLREASRQGITEIINTVHFQHPKVYNKNIGYDYLKNKTKELQTHIDNENMNIKVHLSAEVFYLPNLVEISKNPLVTVGRKKYMLIEFSPNIFPKNYECQFFDLQTLNITPIVAHPERYRFIHNNFNLLKIWIERGYIIQIDAGSFLGHFGEKTKEFTLAMINKGYIHLIGSDAHNQKKRNFCLSDAYDFLDSNFGKEFVNILKENSYRLLKGDKILNIDCKIFKNKKNKLSFLDKIKNKFTLI